MRGCDERKEKVKLDVTSFNALNTEIGESALNYKYLLIFIAR